MGIFSRRRATLTREEKTSKNAYQTRRTIYIVSIVWALSSSTMALRPNPYSQLLMMFALPGMIFCFGFALAYFRFSNLVGARVFVPLAVCLLASFPPPMIAGAVREFYFANTISELEEEIEQYRSSGIYPETDWPGDKVSEPFINERGDTIITYWWGAGFPAKHTALVYCSEPDSTFYKGGPSSLKDRGWHRGHELKDNWYVVAD